uniref:Uncharacterized protein n=1 Tax=viral metagenome TaxID=1070528 RepID=A0A6C0C8H7_9ZZZZ
MISFDELTLILNYFPTCKLVHWRLVNCEFKKIIDKILTNRRNGFNCTNFLLTTNNQSKYRLEYGCTHINLWQEMSRDEIIDDYFAVACKFIHANPNTCIDMLNFLSEHRYFFKEMTMNERPEIDTLQKILNVKNYDAKKIARIIELYPPSSFPADVGFLLLKNGSFDILLELQKRNANPSKFDITMNSIVMHYPKIIRVMIGYYLTLCTYIDNLSRFVGSSVNNLFKTISNLNEYFFVFY